MAPVRYKDAPSLFAARQGDLNEVLVHVGLRVNDEGKVQRGATASTLSEAALHADSIRLELRRRGTHPEVIRFCTAEILAKNNFHAILEATKSVAARLRALTDEAGDGAGLVDAALASGRSVTPLLAINTGQTQTERDEQNGLANLSKGIFGMFRNPVAPATIGAEASRANTTATNVTAIEAHLIDKIDASTPLDASPGSKYTRAHDVAVELAKACD
jgi:uncharacterized protein (TIGR02391 family)